MSPTSYPQRRDSTGAPGELASMGFVDFMALLIVGSWILGGLLSRIPAIRDKIIAGLIDHRILATVDVVVSMDAASVTAGLDLPRLLIAAGVLVGCVFVIYVAARQRVLGVIRHRQARP